MNRPRLRTALGATYLFGLLALLSVLATMQYRWAGEASVAERQSMQNALRETLQFLEANFDREISRTVLYFMSRPQVLEGSIPERWRAEMARDLASAYSSWNAATVHPKLVDKILMADNSEGASPALFRVNLDDGKMELQAWPPELIEVRDLLVRNANGTLTEEDLRVSSPLEGRFLSPAFTVAGVPAFVSPLLVDPAPPNVAGAERREVRRGVWRVRTCLIVCLNREYISREWLPSLCSRFLSVEGRMQYDFLVRDSQHLEKVICSSSSGTPFDLSAAPDAAVALLQLKIPEAVEGVLPRERAEKIQQWILESLTIDKPAGSPGEGMRRRPPARPVEALDSKVRPSGVPGGGSPPQEEKERLAARERRGEQVEVLRRILERSAANGWQLLAKHRSGSLAAAVEQSRERNLAVSFGILLVLAASLIAFAVATRRAGRLARQQMEFVASISHELRTPVTAVCSLSENLVDGLVRPPDQIRDYGRMILREGRRLGNLVEQALEYAGISSGHRPFRFEPLAVETLVRDAVQSCEAQLQENGARVETRIDAGLSPIPGDPDALRCALRNLIGNAIKYSPAGAVVAVTARAAAKGGQVEILVSDRGMGIEPEDQKHLFEPFYRGRNALGAQIRGAGIGLSLVKRIVEEHRGEIRISSRPGAGTEAALRLPALGKEPHVENPGG